MMRVLHIIHHLEPGGIEMWLLDVIRGVTYEVHLCCKGPRVGTLVDEAVSAGATIFHAPLHLDHIRHVRRLQNIVEQNKYDIVHVHTGIYCGASILALQASGVPAVVTFHSNSFAPQALRGGSIIHRARAAYGILSTHYAALRAKALTATSEATLVFASDFARRPLDERWSVLPLGVSLPDTPQAGNRSVLESLHVPRGAFVILHVGAFRAAKNHVGLLKIFSKIIQLGNVTPDGARLLLVGDGPLKAVIEQQAVAMGLSHIIHFLGRRLDVPNIMAVSDLFLFPSIVEGFGKAAIEASAAGLPIVASDVGGLSEAVRSQETGFLFRVDDCDGMAGACLRLMNDAALRQRMGAAGRRFVRRNFSISASLDELGRVYDRAMSRNSVSLK